MIVGEQKPLKEIQKMIEPYKKILILGCNTCVAICFAGGEKEAGILASALRMAEKKEGREKEIESDAIQRQCEWEFVDPLKDKTKEFDAVVSIACGIGVQALAERFPESKILPGLNTKALSLPTEPGVWAERCAACGDCILAETEGVCPIARCAKSLLNGPCGGSQEGKCEISKDIDCAWQLIYDRLEERGKLDVLDEIKTPKDWSTGRSGGPKTIIREDLRTEEESSE